jgi:hypothetical protein
VSIFASRVFLFSTLMLATSERVLYFKHQK